MKSKIDKIAADRAVTLISELRQTKGEWAGKPLNLMPWQENIVRKLFGTLNKDGTRQYRTCYIELPRKNGKSTLAAAFANYLLFLDGEMGAEIYSAANDRDQASIVYNEAASMVEQDPALNVRATILSSVKRIYVPSTRSFYRAISAEAYCVHSETLFDRADGVRVKAKEITPGMELLAWDETTQRLIFSKVKSTETQGPASLYRIRTSRGREIEVTGNHRFQVMDPGRRDFDLTHRYSWKRANELKEGYRIRVSLGWRNHNRSLYTKQVEEAWALGAWAGDGECGRFRFINVDDLIVQRLRNLIRRKGGDLTSAFSTRQKQGKSSGDYPQEHSIQGHVRRRKSPGREWIRTHFGENARSHTKRVPEVIWAWPRQAWRAFLAGYLDTDGCVPTTAPCVKWSSESPELLIDCQALLARMGINGSINRNMLTVSGKEQLGLMDSLLTPYMSHPEKINKLRNHVANRRQHDFHAHESDRVVEITRTSPVGTYSIEMEDAHTHITNGLVSHNTKHGYNAHGVIYDELHAAPDRDLWDVLTTSVGSRRQPLVIVITTAGFDRNSICWEQHDYAEKVLKGVIKDPTFLPVIYAAPDDADWTDPEVWKACNPALGTFRNLDELASLCKKAQETPALEMTFRRLYLNQWVNSTERWLPMEAWDSCKAKVDIENLKGVPCYAGLDLASTTDLTALLLDFPREDGMHDVLAHFWIPGDTAVEKEKKDRVPYRAWAKKGLITLTEGNVVDYRSILQFIEDWLQLYDIRELAFDRWGSQKLVVDLEELGFTSDTKESGRKLIAFGQGYASMSSPTKELMNLVLQKKIRHGGNPILRWNADNLVVQQDPAGNLKPDKAKATQKIDGMVALIMAISRASVNANIEEKSIYETQGITFI